MSEAAMSADMVLGQALNFAEDQLPTIAKTLTPSDFIDVRARLIYQTMLDLMRNGDSVDGVTVYDALKAKGQHEKAGGAAYIAELMEMGGVTPIVLTTNIKLIRRESRARKLEQTLRDGLSQLESGEDPVVVMGRMESGLVKLGRTYEEKPQDDMVQHCISLAEKLEPGIVRGQPWPWTGLDDAIGYMMDGRLYVVVGFSGSGKSTLLRPLALGYAMMGVKVAYFSVEEKAGEEVLAYMACALMGVNYTRYGWGYALTPDECDLLTKGMNEIYNTGNLILNDEKYWTPHQLLAKARYYIEEHGVKVIVVDHAHRLDYGDGDERKVEYQVGMFAQNMKKLMQTTGAAAVVAYQPRKPGQGGDIYRPVSPDEIRGTSVIWNEADNTLSPFRPWVLIDPITEMTKLDASGLPIIKKPFDEDAQPAKHHFFMEPGKRRVGGALGRPIVQKFDPISARIDDL
jgi:replicative DNA helicase